MIHVNSKHLSVGLCFFRAFDTTPRRPDGIHGLARRGPFLGSFTADSWRDAIIAGDSARLAGLFAPDEESARLDIYVVRVTTCGTPLSFPWFRGNPRRGVHVHDGETTTAEVQPGVQD